jgi:hypothetical protein
VELLGESAEGDGYRWESVRSLATGMTGYLADTFLTSGSVVDGLYIWAVDFYEGIDLPEDDPGFSPLNKQAESVIADCFADLLEDSAMGVLGAPPRQ